MTPSPSEIEQARAAVSVACLRWLGAGAEAVHPTPRRAPREPGRFEPYNVPATPRDRDHPLWDPWLDGGFGPR